MKTFIKKNYSNLLWILAVILIFVCLFFVTNSFVNKTEKSTDKKEENLNVKVEIINGKNNYAIQTAYVGDPVLDEVLFNTPFKKTENYICNAYYINDKTIDSCNITADKIKKFTEEIFNITYKDIERKKMYLENNPNYNTNLKGIDLEEYLDNCVNKQISMESKFITDKCMVYYDNYNTIIRGQLFFTIYECNDLEYLEKLFEIENIKLGEENSILMELYLGSTVNDIKSTEYKINTITILEKR